MLVWFKRKHNVKKVRRRMGVSPRSGDLDSQGATRRDSGSVGAVGDASLRGGVLSSDEGRSKGGNGESGESEHGVGVVWKRRIDVSNSHTQRRNLQGVRLFFAYVINFIQRSSGLQLRGLLGDTLGNALGNALGNTPGWPISCIASQSAS